MIRSVFSFFYFFISLVFFAVCCIISGLFPSPRPTTWFVRKFGKLVLWVAGIKLEVEGLENLDPDQPAIYMANHSTILDIAILPAALPVDIRFMFKHSLGYIPFVGWALIISGGIPIKRGTKGPAMKSLRKAAERIKKGTSIIMFPEGTRTKTGELGELKKGGFLLANLAEANIVPVHISDTSIICKRDLPFTKPGPLKVTIHPVMPHAPNDKKKRKEIIEKVQTLLQANVL